MANTIAPFGALDFVHQGGSQRTEELRQVWIRSSDVTPIFYGDIVAAQLTDISTSDQNSGFGPYITQGCSGGITTWAGVFRGCELYNSALQKMYYSRYFPGQSAAGTSSQTGDIKAYIQSDASMRFIIQASSVVVLGSSNVGNLFSPGVNGALGNPSTAANGGSVTTGNSGMQIISSQATAISSQTAFGATSSYAFQLVDFYSNWGPGLLPGTVPGTGTGQFVNGMDNTTVGQYCIVKPWNWSW